MVKWSRYMGSIYYWQDYFSVYQDQPTPTIVLMVFIFLLFILVPKVFKS